jgi:GNAT superfamily N-acetyltransferase
MPFLIKRTTTEDPHFQYLITCLDNELWNELKEDQATYDPHNKVPSIPTAVLVYHNDEVVASGCFKPFNENTVEIKRMFVQKDHRGKGVSKKVLAALEEWAIEKGYKYAVLETSIRFTTACRLYQSNGYDIIPNYGPYIDLEESVCMRKDLQSNHKKL